MHNRSMGVIALTFTSVMVALYTQIGAFTLVLGGSFYATLGSSLATAALVIGAIFMGIGGAAYVAAYGIWMRRQWSWSAAMVIFLMLIVANVGFSLISSNLLSAVLPTLGALAAVLYMQRPALKTELLGTGAAAPATVAVTEPLDAAEPAH